MTDLIRQVEVAVYNVKLADDLQRSRHQLVTAREEERRRLRRESHDGLGSQLATLMFKLDAARNLLTRDPVTADALLGQTKELTKSSLNEIRRIAHDLRPPALDELGLVSAIREYVNSSNVSGVQISVEVPSALPTLPAAVEVATYRIAIEALTNVIRHAKAKHCWFRLFLDSDLRLVRIPLGTLL